MSQRTFTFYAFGMLLITSGIFLWINDQITATVVRSREVAYNDGYGKGYQQALNDVAASKKKETDKMAFEWWTGTDLVAARSRLCGYKPKVK